LCPDTVSFMSARDVLANLRRQIDNLERPEQVEPSRVEHSPSLVELIPGRALGPGSSVEVVGGPCSGKVSVAFTWIAAVTSRGALALWIDLPGTFYPPAAECVGVDLSRLLVVRPHNESDGARALGIALASGVFEVVMADWGPGSQPLSDIVARRLCARSRQGRGGFYLLTTGTESQLGFRADVRLRHVPDLQAADSFRVERSRPPRAGEAPWFPVGSTLSLGSVARAIEPVWEEVP
jgi:hypothetical protein